jgi:hypothetical protein
VEEHRLGRKGEQARRVDRGGARVGEIEGRRRMSKISGVIAIFVVCFGPLLCSIMLRADNVFWIRATGMVGMWVFGVLLGFMFRETSVVRSQNRS